MNSMQIKDRLKNISKNKNVDFNTILRLYMYDRFVERLARSKYKDNFILKGGFYLSTLFGVESRNTMDIDMSFRKETFTKENIEQMIKEIIAIDIQDNSEIEFIDISLIRDEDEYSGFRVELIVKIENIKEKFHLDIATGDYITPGPISHKYDFILKDKSVNVWAYNLETVLAEKLETILSRLETNSRMRDFYDIYLIYSREWNNLNKDNFRKSVNNTFSNRDFTGNIVNIFEVIRKSSILEKKWRVYSKKYKYASDLKYEQIMECLEAIISVL